MKKLLEFIVSNITGSDKFEVSETQEEGRIVFNITADQEIVGLIIGKEGKTIKNIRKLVSVPAVLQRKAINIGVSER